MNLCFSKACIVAKCLVRHFEDVSVPAASAISIGGAEHEKD